MYGAKRDNIVTSWKYLCLFHIHPYVDHTIVVFIIGWVIPEKLAWYPFNNIAFGLPWWRRVVSDGGMTVYSSCSLLRRHCTTAANNVKMMTQTQIETVAFNQISNAKAVFILAPGEKRLVWTPNESSKY